MPDIFLLGPLLKGARAETIAVPELRLQARTVVTTILREVSGEDC